MVVGHADGHVVRVVLAQDRLGIVGQVEAVLIPVERVDGGYIGHAVSMVQGVLLVVEEFPSAAADFEGT